jgi:hypothetical protein
MATPGRTQKQIAERYKGNLGYYKKTHPWRAARFIVSFLALSGGLAAIIAFQRRGNEEFFSTGKISSNHAIFAQDCAQCHDKGATLSGDHSLSKIHAVVKERFHRGLDFTAIDRKCEACHEGRPPYPPRPITVGPKEYDLHEPNVVENRSCSICHMEHLGPGPMKRVADLHCASCHNNREIMEASAQKGEKLPPTAFHLRPQPPQQIVFELPRPPRGYTQVFASFATDHPPFQIESTKVRDPNVLRFNHQRHEASDIPQVNGKKLDCNYCHQPGPDGRFYKRISFAANCQACHSLQFDAKNPELTLPHGDPTAIRGFLRSLPAQYADLAVRKGIVRQDEIQKFVAQQILGLRDRVRSGEDFERQIFFTVDPYKPQRQAGPQTRGSFYGCAFCHQVTAVANTAPMITKPILIDRWMTQAHFNHAKHTSVKCDTCHNASQSRETSDILMPAKANCVECHSPKGKVASDCITCHTYHAPGQAAVVAGQTGGGPGSFKQMLLSGNR